MREQVVGLLREMARAMRAAGDRQRLRAYEAAAAEIERRADLEDLYRRRRLQSIPGVGPSIERTILDFLREGKRPAWLDEATSASPAPLSAADVHAYQEAPFADAPDLHVHTSWSDGSLSLEEVVLRAKELGAEAVGITDHSGSLRIARGLRPEDVRAQWAEIARVQLDQPDILILRGTECDILRDGRLDHPDELLAQFDFVVGSLHSQLKLDRKAQTERVLAALENEHLTILGHPTTRVPGRRPAAHLDLPRIFEKAAQRGVAMEVNGNPGRLDLDVTLAREALAAGCRLSCSSDGHSAREMLAFATARKMAAEAGATEADLVNYDVVRAARPRPQQGSLTAP